MRTIRQTGQFKRDLKREARGPHKETISADFLDVVKSLAGDEPLPEKLRDHSLTGEWKDCRDCHIKPDLVLIYRKQDDELQLIRLGSHSELGL